MMLLQTSTKRSNIFKSCVDIAQSSGIKKLTCDFGRLSSSTFFGFVISSHDYMIGVGKMQRNQWLLLRPKSYDREID